MERRQEVDANAPRGDQACADASSSGRFFTFWCRYNLVMAVATTSKINFSFGPGKASQQLDFGALKGDRQSLHIKDPAGEHGAPAIVHAAVDDDHDDR